jgi:FhuF-like iron-sulfur protein
MNMASFADLLNGKSEWLEVRAADTVPGPDWISCAQVLSEQLAGADPLASWRRKLHSHYGTEYDTEPPPQVASMIVLMWYIGVPLYVAAVATALTGESPDVSARGLAFRLHPTGHYPTEIALLPGPVLPLKETTDAVLEHCRAFVDSYPAGVKLSSRQRRHAIVDDLRATLREAAEQGAPHAAEVARAFAVDPSKVIRDTCCYFYTLPNVNACGTCPRLLAPS